MATITWGTASDWDNAVVNTEGSVHESVSGTDRDDDTIIQMGVPYETPLFAADVAAYWPFDDSSGPIGDLSPNNISGTVSGATLDVTGDLGTTAASLDGSDDEINFGEPAALAASNLGDSFSACVIIKPTGQSSRGQILAHGGTGGNDNFWIYEDSGVGLYLDTNGSTGTVNSGFVPSTSEYHVVVFSYDSDGTVHGTSGCIADVDGVEQINVTGYSGAWASGSGNDWIVGNREGQSEWWGGDLAFACLWDTALSSTERDTVADLLVGEQSLTTATKTFSSAVEPDLQNLSYTLNGETIDVDVIGSPGTTSEEIVTQTLTGASSYTLSWSGAHTDFRVRPNLSTSDPTVTPTVSSISLEATNPPTAPSGLTGDIV